MHHLVTSFPFKEHKQTCEQIRETYVNNKAIMRIGFPFFVFFSHLFQGYSLMRQQLFRIEIERVV